MNIYIYIYFSFYIQSNMKNQFIKNKFMKYLKDY